MTKMLCLIIIISVLVSGGCATTPVKYSDAIQAPKDRLLAYQDNNEKTTASIILTRDEGFLGGGCFYSFYINSNLAARLNPGETSKFYLEPGEVLLKVGRDPFGNALCGAMLDEWTQRDAILKQGDIKYYRMSIDANGKIDIQRAE